MGQKIKQEVTNDYIFSTLQNPWLKYECPIPDVLGGLRMRGCFHGWLILSNHPHNNSWSLYNVSDSSVIHLPLLMLQAGVYQKIRECCLSAPPDDPDSVILLTITNKPTFVFCFASPKRNNPRWSEMSYSIQLKKLTLNGKQLHSLTCCNGKIYALDTDNGLGPFVIHVDIQVPDRQVVIELLLFGPCPSLPSYRCFDCSIHFLKGYGTELFYVVVGFHDKTMKTVGDVYLFKSDVTRLNLKALEDVKSWDMTGKRLDDLYADEDFVNLDIEMLSWDEVHDLKDAIFFVDLGRDNSIFYNPGIASELGGFIHIRDKVDNVIHSYHVHYQTLVPSPIPSPSLLPTSHMSIREYGLQDDHGKAKSTVDTKKEEYGIVEKSVTNDQVGSDESGLLGIPFDVLAKIMMEFCVGVEYMNFRATCKRCHLAAPQMQWRNKTALSRLQSYSVVSPWLMVVQKHRGVITFKDPMLGDDYYMKNPQIIVFDEKIYCSRFGWLLFEMGDRHSRRPLVFLNPFTNDLRELPELGHLFESLWFSAPPTSPKCMVVGLGHLVRGWLVHIHHVAGQPTWRTIHLGPRPLLTWSSTLLVGQDFYALSDKRDLHVHKKLGEEDSCWMVFEATPKSCSRSRAQYYLVKCDNQHDLLLVIMGRIGEPIEIFKLNESTKEWEKIDGIGKHTIYICDASNSVCIEAKMPEMENKIFLPQVCSANGKIVFYSLETQTFHAFNGKSVQDDVTDISNIATHLSAHAWVDPSWS